MISLEDRQMLLSDLQLLIGKSASLMYDISKEKCVGSYINDESCSWYHGAWQFLRACDKVSSPTWHLDFYLDSLTTILKPHTKILISGTADYSTLSIVLFVAKKLNLELDIFVMDICKTPLFICEWYAEQLGANIRALNKNIFELLDFGYYDLMISDAFLTRFEPAERKNLLKHWSNLLTQYGKIITTIRIEEGLSDNVVSIPNNQSEEFVKEVTQVFNRLNINTQVSDIETLARSYIRNIKSYPYKNMDEVYRDFNTSGLDIIECTESIVKGETKPTKYLRLIATPTNSSI